jgi:hypothetical protein
MLVFGLGAACSDPAIRHRADLEERLRALQDSGAQRGSLHVGDEADGPRWLVLFPARETSVAELEHRGVDPQVAAHIFDQLGYVGVGTVRGPKLVVVPDRGRISFTSPRLLVVREPSAGRCEPRCAVHLERVEEGWAGVVAAAGRDEEGSL